MQTTIKVFASLKALAGADQLTLELQPGATVADALAQLDWIDDDTPLVVAVNREYADRSATISPGDELALIPPVSGGAGDAEQPATDASSGAAQPAPGDSSAANVLQVRVTQDPIDQAQLAAAVADPRAGAIVAFMGVTREVPALEYEAYAEMAVAEITRIAQAALQRHGLCRVAVTHRFGTVPLSEASVVIAVSAPHRAEAFAGAREVIDELKRSVPIWKREEGEWVAGNLPGPTSR